MDKKINKFLDNLLENEVLDTEIYQKIIKFDENNNLSQKSKVARAITLIGGFFLLSGLLGTLPLQLSLLLQLHCC